MLHGLEDTCSDDALWIIATVCEFVKETGDVAFIDHVIPFADGGSASVYDHLKRSLDFSTEQVGATGVCKGLRADWNDCLNLGGGESAMVSFLHHWALRQFVELAKFVGRQEDVEKYSAIADNIRAVGERELWDGEWYLRGFTRKGIKIGTHENEEGKIFLESNTWAVLSDAATPEHGRQCMDSVYKHLFSPYGTHLVWPAYGTPDDDIGYVTRVYKGIKENAAIFSHPNAWTIVAECKLGRGDRAMEFYDAFLPYNQNDMIDVREAEPYSYVQFVMGKDHTAHGRARHPWLTGTASWVYYAVTHWVLGIRQGFNELVVDPCIPTAWDGFLVHREWRGASYNIQVQNPSHVSKGVKSVTLNGTPIVGNAIPLQPAGSENEVVVVLG